MELSKYIKEILISRDSVIIPNFGAFEKTMLSARIDPNSGQMHPPQTGIVFKPEIKTDSGILIKHVAEKESIGEEKAAEEIKAQVLQWETALNQGQQVLLSGIGTLAKDNSGNINYESSISADDFPESFGLPVINVQEKAGNLQTEVPQKEAVKPEQKKVEQKKVEQKKPEIKKPQVKQKETIIPDSSQKPKSNKKLIIALVVLIPIIAVGVYTALNFNFVKQKYKDTSHYVSGLLNKNSVDSIKTDTIAAKDSLVNVDSSMTETNQLLENYTIIDESTNTRVNPDAGSLSTYKKVHIIAGSFKNKSFANRQRKALVKKGFEAKVLPEYIGLYRVSVASYNDVESAAKDFDRIKSVDETLSYWILVNK